jgi:predicted nucleotidyltransferase
MKPAVAEVPRTYQKDVRPAVTILQEEGCAEVYLFGSLAGRKTRRGSDIDLAVRGCPKGEFFHVLGRLLLELDHSVHLVNLDTQGDFAQYLQREAALVRIG